MNHLEGLTLSEKIIQRMIQTGYPENTKPAAMQKDITAFETELKRIVEQEQKYRSELTKALADYAEIKQQSEPLDRTELYRTRLALRPGYENAAIDGLRKMLGGDFSIWDFRDAVAAADTALGERTEENRVRELLRTQERQKRSAEKWHGDMER